MKRLWEKNQATPLDSVPSEDNQRELRFPGLESPRVQEMASEIQELSKADSRLNNFHREYFKNSLYRIAMNVVFLRDALGPNDRLLDLGSFGIEPALLLRDLPDLTLNAASYEGNVIGLGEDGFFETTDSRIKNTIRIDQVDVERDAFPYADDSFDWVTAFEILEHLRFSPEPMLNEIKRVLRPGGTLVLSTPNICSALSYLKMLKGESPQECPYYHSIFEYGIIHPKEYSTGDLRAILEHFGFEIDILETIDTSHVSDQEKVIRHKIAELKAELVDQFGPEFAVFDTGERMIAIARNVSERADGLPAKIFS